MLKEYYEILDIPRTATQEEIARAFKLNSLKLHPNNHNKPNKDIFNAFSNICEAYEVLSDPEKRSIYDVYGIEKLKNGFYSENNDLIGCYEFKGNSDEIFTKFFGTPDFHSALVQHEDAYNRYLNERNRLKRQPPKDILIEHTLSLLDIYKGTTLSISFTKETINPDGITTSPTPTTKQANKIDKNTPRLQHLDPLHPGKRRTPETRLRSL